MDFWFYQNFKETQQFKIWRAGLSHLIDSIDPKYFNYEMKQPVGFVGFLSQFYYIGDASYTDTNINSHFKF
jgi:hypothetical protein